MSRVRRSSSIFVLFSDRVAVDLNAFFSGKVSVNPKVQALGISLVTGRTLELAPEILTLFASINLMSWNSLTQVSQEYGIESAELERLITDGFLITDDEGSDASRMRELDTRLDRVNWNPHQALAYVMARWSEPEPGEKQNRARVDLESFDKLVAAYGAAPPHFHQVESLSRFQLPEAAPGGELFDLLTSRYTAREFNTSKLMPQADLARLLHFTFGAQAEIPLTEGLTVLKKTSPSGGALHPVEAYPPHYQC